MTFNREQVYLNSLVSQRHPLLHDPPDGETLGNAGIKKFAKVNKAHQQEPDIEVGIVGEQCLCTAMNTVDADSCYPYPRF